MVTRIEAMQRRKLKQPIVSQADEQGNRLAFSLAIGDTVKLTWEGRDVLAVVQKLSYLNYVFRLLSDARPAKEIGHGGIEIRSDKTFFATRCQKLSIDPLGAYHVSHD